MPIYSSLTEKKTKTPCSKPNCLDANCAQKFSGLCSVISSDGSQVLAAPKKKQKQNISKTPEQIDADKVSLEEYSDSQKQLLLQQKEQQLQQSSLSLSLSSSHAHIHGDNCSCQSSQASEPASASLIFSLLALLVLIPVIPLFWILIRKITKKVESSPSEKVETSLSEKVESPPSAPHNNISSFSGIDSK